MSPVFIRWWCNRNWHPYVSEIINNNKKCYIFLFHLSVGKQNKKQHSRVLARCCFLLARKYTALFFSRNTALWDLCLGFSCIGCSGNCKERQENTVIVALFGASDLVLKQRACCLSLRNVFFHNLKTSVSLCAEESRTENSPAGAASPLLCRSDPSTCCQCSS